MSEPKVEIFVNIADDESESVALLIRDASVVEYEDQLVPGCLLSPELARHLAGALIACAEDCDQ